MKLPINNQWTQPNNSDKFGSVWYTKNINFDEAGYAKLSPRMVKIIDEASNSDMGVPLAIGQFSDGDFQVATSSQSNFVVDIDTNTLTVTEDTGTANPTTTTDSHGIFWLNRWHVSTATAVVSKDANGNGSATWTSRITGLTSGVKHLLEINEESQTIMVTNGNVVKQYDTSYVNTTDLTIDASFEIIGIAYNGGNVGLITKVGDSTNERKESKFFLWDGTSTSAIGSWGISAESAIAIAPYQSSFVILTSNGQLKYFNGGGFQDLATFPFFFDDKKLSFAVNALGTTMQADGDILYINIGVNLNNFSRKEYRQMVNCPSGVWCYDPNIGLYHRWSPSISQAYIVQIADGGTDTTTNIITAQSGTISQTGSIARYVRTFGAGIGGLTINQDYYVTKLSSTTFKLSETREDMENLIYVDLTADDTDVSKFFMYDIIDYGTSFYDDSGAVLKIGEYNQLYQDIMIGGDFYTSTVANNDTLCMVVPHLENRGQIISPKRFAGSVEDNAVKVYVRYAPLGENDTIRVKVRTEDVYGLPISSPNIKDTDYASWTSSTEFDTTTDLSVAKTYLDAGGELEIEFVAGVGAGQCVKITDIDEDSGTYSVILEEEVIGASSGLRSYFSIWNWKYIGTIDNSQNSIGYKEFPIALTSKFIQAKIELIGSNIKIEQFEIVNQNHKQ